MVNYQYQAVDKQGKKATGHMMAEDLLRLQTQLKENGYWLIQAKEARERQAAGEGNQKIKTQTIMEFVTHMHSLLEAGVPILSALNGLARESPNPQFGQILDTIWRTVETGVPLHAAMSKFPKVFSQLLINLVQAGEESGTLPETFGELQRYLEWVERMKGEIRQALIYPATILLAVLALFILLFTFVIPRFEPILNSLNVPLPIVTVMVLSFSGFMEHTWWMWIVLALIIPLGVWFFKRTVPSFAYQLDALILRVPVFGQLRSMLSLARFTHNFGVLYRSGIPVLQALSLCQTLVGNRVLAKALGEVEQAVSEGATMSNALRQHPVFPSILIQMVTVGEATGRLDKTLIHIASHYNQEIPRRVKKVFGIMEPMVTVGLIGMVGLVALSIFLPLMSLMGGMR